MKVRYTSRFYPTSLQKHTLARVFGTCRYIYNWALRLRTDTWQNKQKSVGYHETSTLLTQLKRQEKTKWLCEISCVPPQQALRHLQTAFVNFWNKTSKYPTFKKKRNTQSAEYTKSAFKWDAENKNLRVSGLGRLNIHWSREFTSKPSTTTITKRPSGRYFVTLCLDEHVEFMPKTGERVGIDLGINRLATLSNGERIPNPKHLANKLSKLRREQHILSRRKKDSGRWNRQRVKIARIHEHITNSRKDWLDKVTTNFVRRFDRIQIEDLNVCGMIGNHCLARAISDVGMSMFRTMLTYKCERYGKDLRVIDRWFPSSKRCFGCGHVVERLPLDIRRWTCSECSQEHDRDENAAKNIEAAEGHSVKARGANRRRGVSTDTQRNSHRSVNQLSCERVQHVPPKNPRL